MTLRTVMRHTFFLAVFSALAFGQALPANQTTPAGFRNGRYWNSRVDSLRLFYLAGYFDGFDKGILEFLNRDTEKRILALESANIPSVTNGETLTALNRFYADPENLNIPIWRAIRVAALKFAARPAREAEAEMEAARAVIRSDWEQCEKKKLGCEHLR
jgi:hypothetical protein